VAVDPVTPAVNVLIRAVSPIVHVAEAAPVASVVEVAGVTLPPPPVTLHTTAALAAGCPAFVTWTRAGTSVLTTATRSENPESAVTFKPAVPPFDPPGLLLGGVVVESSDPLHAETATSAERRRKVRMP